MLEKKRRFALSLDKYKSIIIFGAKRRALETYDLIKDKGFDIECFMVSERSDNPYVLNEKSVKTFAEICLECRKNSLVVISQTYEINDEIREILFQEGFKNIIESPIQYIPFWKKNISAYFADGLYVVKGDCFKKAENINTLNITIYAVTSHKNTHRQKEIYKSKYIKYIQAGAGLTNIVTCDITDNKGDNISEKNAFFCELTAGYWAYKNDHESDYIGLYHYSRGLEMSDSQIDEIVGAGVDVVLPDPYIYRYAILEMTERVHVNIMMEAIYNIYPEYVCSTERFFSSKEFFPGNIVFAKKKIFCEYYKWMLDVIKECEKIKKKRGYPIKERIWGYYGEYLTTIYFKHHIKKYERVLYSKMKNLF